MRLLGTRLFPGDGRGGDLGGKIFPKLPPAGEPMRPFTEHRHGGTEAHLGGDGKEILTIPSEVTDRLAE